MPPVAVDVHLEIRDSCAQEPAKELVGPQRVSSIADASAHDEYGWCVVWNGHLRAASERRRPWINQSDEVRPRTDLGERVSGDVVLLVVLTVVHSGRRRELCAGRESHGADLLRIDPPVFCVRADDFDGL